MRISTRARTTDMRPKKTAKKGIRRKIGCPGEEPSFRRSGARSVLVYTKTLAPHPLPADSG